MTLEALLRGGDPRQLLVGITLVIRQQHAPPLLVLQAAHAVAQLVDALTGAGGDEDCIRFETAKHQALVGKVAPDGLIYTDWSSGSPVQPDPFLKGYDWAKGLSG